jgi:hypothetical protein
MADRRIGPVDSAGDQSDQIIPIESSDLNGGPSSHRIREILGESRLKLPLIGLTDQLAGGFKLTRAHRA